MVAQPEAAGIQAILKGVQEKKFAPLDREQIFRPPRPGHARYRQLYAALAALSTLRLGASRLAQGRPRIAPDPAYKLHVNNDLH